MFILTLSVSCGLAFRLVNTKSMALVDQWKKVSHSNLVSLREVFTTKSFGDNCKCRGGNNVFYQS